MKFQDCLPEMILWYDLIFHLSVPWFSYLIPVVEPSNCFSFFAIIHHVKLYICRNKSLCTILMVSLRQTSRSVITLHKVWMLLRLLGCLLSKTLLPPHALPYTAFKCLFTVSSGAIIYKGKHLYWSRWMSLNCWMHGFSSWIWAPLCLSGERILRSMKGKSR